MRKRNILYLFDTLFWYLLYFLPVLFYIIRGSGAMLDFFNSIGLSLTDNNVVLTNLADIFGSNGILPLFSDNTILVIVSWFVCVFLTHLFVDFLLFIPRLCHKWLDAFCKGDD